MVHQVRAHRLVQSQLERHLQLGSHSIRRAHQNRILPALHIQPEKRAKAADPSHHIAVESLLRQILDAFLGAIAAADVHTGVGVSHGLGGCGLGLVWHGKGFLRRSAYAQEED